MKDFKVSYQRAFEHILPDRDCLAHIMDKVEEKQRRKKYAVHFAVVAAAGVCVIMTLLSLATLPVMAKSSPAVYRMIEKYAPALSDYILPVKRSATSEGITMQVEAIDIKEQGAEIMVSFCDEAGSGQDLIKGQVDLYDSYHLQTYGESYGIGGCSFLEYDASEDKAYFMISLGTDGIYDREKVRFSVDRLLCRVDHEKRRIALDRLVKEPELKTVSVNGQSGMMDNNVFERYRESAVGDSPLPAWKVMDLAEADESMAGTLTVTGVGYSDGILRVQVCCGNFGNADRHLETFLVDSAGNESRCDGSVMWHEEPVGGGEKFMFAEDWFLIDEKELDQMQLYGIYHVIDGSVEGDWEVTFRLEPVSE